MRDVNILKVKWVETKKNLADFFTKCFDKKIFIEACEYTYLEIT